MPQIASLPPMPRPAVYSRKQGYYLKLDERFHIKTTLNTGRGTWQRDGNAEEFDPNEEVLIVVR